MFNTPPVAPGGLSTSIAGNAVTFSWTASTDSETPQTGLSYNLRVGTTSGGNEITSGMADAVSGLRRIPATGNAQKRLSWTVKGLAVDTYYWSVQAVDTAFAGSAWAGEQTVALLGTQAYTIVDLTTGGFSQADTIPDLLTNAEYKTTKLVLKRVEAGSFQMGDEVNVDVNADEEPDHLVNITQPFYAGVFEVTQMQWQTITGSNPSSFTSFADSDRRPVESVSWNDINGSGGFMETIGALTAIGFRLPTEAEWEYCCKAGTSTNFSYGDAENGAYMWDDSNSGGETHEVGTKLASPWGLHDMHGNVREWCQDRYGDTYYQYCVDNSITDDPQGPSSGSFRVIRDGSWGNSGLGARSSQRIADAPITPNFTLGFRVIAGAAGP